MGFCLVPFEAADLEGEPGTVDEQAYHDLRIHPAFLRISDLAQVVFLLCLEVQRGDVVEHQAQSAGRGGMLETFLRDPVSVIACGATLQCVGVGVAVGRGQSDLGDDPAGVAHRCRLDEPTEDQLEERVVVDSIETQASPSGLDRLDQPAGPFRRDHRSAFPTTAEVEVEFLLAGLQLFPGRLQQCRQLALGVGGTEVLKDLVAAPVLRGDLHRRRPPTRSEPCGYRQPQPAILPTD